VKEAIEAEGGASCVFHRPPFDDGAIRIGWTTEEGAYATRFHRDLKGLVQDEELLEHRKLGPAWARISENQRALVYGKNVPPPLKPHEELDDEPFSGFGVVLEKASKREEPFYEICLAPLLAREVKLALAALRQDAEVVPSPNLNMDGSNLPAVLGLWRGSEPERAEQLHEFVRKCLPEVKHVFVKPSPTPGYQRLWVKQSDGEEFDADHLSDGVLCFIALAMHAIEAQPKSLIFIEEPEQSIHPRRLGDLVNLFRQIVRDRGCQVVLATHSPVLLDEFRDEPESILLFRRGDQGSLVKPLTEVPRLIDALRDAQPGEMLANGFFNDPF